MNKSESITKLAASLVKAQSQMGNATKDAKNPFYKSNYADLNSVREAVTPALNANGITVLQPTISIDGNAFVETVLLHESGEFLSSMTQIIVAKQNDPQAAGSGISYARRYGLQSLLSVGAQDDDGEAAMGRKAGTERPTVAPKVDVTTIPKAVAAPVKADAPAMQNTLPAKKSTFRKTVSIETADDTVAGGNGWE